MGTVNTVSITSTVQLPSLTKDGPGVTIQGADAGQGTVPATL